jgi:hypothetical protein
MSKFRIARISLMLAAIGLNAVPSLMTGVHAQNAKPAAEAPKDTVRPEFAKALDTETIKGLMAKKDFAGVQARVTQAEALGNLNPYESYILNRVKIALGSGTQNEALTRQALEAVIASGRLQPAEEADFQLVLANQDYNAKNYTKAIERYKRYQQLSPTPEKARGALVRSYYLNNNFDAAKTELLATLDAAQKAGKQPEQEDLRLLASAAGKLKDWPTYTLALEKLVLISPTDDYWTDLLSRGIASKKTFNDRLRLDYYRLEDQALSALAPEEYVEMAELSLIAGLPTEAKKVLDKGFKAGVLGTGSNAGKHKQLLDKANKGAADDAKNIASGEASAAKMKNGTGLVNLGYAYVTMDQFDKGIGFIEQGIAKGGIKTDEAKLKLGAAYAKAGRKADAIKVFESLKGDDGVSDLAKYWVLLLNSPASKPATAAN